MDNKTPELDENIQNTLRAHSDSIIDNTYVDNEVVSEDLVALYHCQHRNLYIGAIIKCALSILTPSSACTNFSSKNRPWG